MPRRLLASLFSPPSPVTAQTLSEAPGLFSFARLATLGVSLVVAVCSGTNYVFSAYSPQLGRRLGISHTKVNIVGLAGNIGVYSSGPFWGRIVDARGPKLPMVLAFLLLLIGYSGIRAFYDGSADSTESLSTVGLYTLVVCSYLSGAGGNAGFTGAVNSTAKSFPDKLRATANGIVLSGFGLSAFFFSTLAHYAFPGNTSAFLLLLSLGASTPMLVGAFFVRPVPLPLSLSETSPENGHQIPTPRPRLDSSTHLLSGSLPDEERDEEARHLLEPTTPAEEYVPDARTSVELDHRSVSRARSQSRSRSGALKSVPQTHGYVGDLDPDISGRALWTSADFWLLFIILSILSGTGIMYINNVGSMAQALFAFHLPSGSAYDEERAAKWQSAQVSTISVMNFSGRIIIGLINDYTHTRMRLPRSYTLVLVALLMCVSQVVAASVTTVQHLYLASTALGLAYGSTFGLFPTLAIDWFGLPHFSENWGFLSLSPMFGGNLFSLAFGRNLDAHETPSSPSSQAATGEVRCAEGLECYVATLRLTMGACVLAVGLSVWAGWRDRRRHRVMRERLLAGSGEEGENGALETLWDEDVEEEEERSG